MKVRWLGTVPYQETWTLQQQLAIARAGDEIDDTLLLLEHHSVYTAGRRTEAWERPFDGTEVIDVDRGGKITWHGPGQLVGYPIVKLPDPVDVVAHVRRLEAALIDVCAQFGVGARRVDGRSGVWTTDGERKIAAIGIRVQRGVTFHGFALNCDPDLAAFGKIVPCGLVDVGVTSLTQELGRTVTVDEVRPVAQEAVVAVLTAAAAHCPVSATPIAPVGVPA
jgi:lipoyl(octanoyl) transferase